MRRGGGVRGGGVRGRNVSNSSDPYCLQAPPRNRSEVLAFRIRISRTAKRIHSANQGIKLSRSEGALK